MEFGLFVAGFMVALAAAYFGFVKGLMQENKELKESGEVEVTIHEDLLSPMVESVYSLEFGGYGVRPEMVDEAYNKLWRFIGKPEKGRPPQ